MSDRDRLIELLLRGSWDYLLCKENIELLTDHILADGWIRPPCKVGDKIYYIDKYSGKVEEDIVRFFTVTQNGTKPILVRHNTKFWDMYEWGKTVFLTKEEAERALKEREQGGC